MEHYKKKESYSFIFLLFWLLGGLGVLSMATTLQEAGAAEHKKFLTSPSEWLANRGQSISQPPLNSSFKRLARAEEHHYAELQLNTKFRLDVLFEETREIRIAQDQTTTRP